MDIRAIASPEFAEVDVGTKLGKVRSVFDRENPKGLIVTDDGEYTGVVTERQLLRSRIEDDTKVSTLVRPAPRLDRTEDVREVARKLVEGGVKVAPVYEGERLYGVVTADAILDAVLDNLDALTVEQILTENVVTVGESDHVGQAINRLRDNGISRLPVVDDEGRLSGVMTTHDVVEFVVRTDERQHKGDRSGDSDRMLDLPVYDLMTAPVLTTTPGESVRDAVARMLAEDLSGLVVTPDDDPDTIAGVVTKTDVLRALTYTEETRMDVQITNVELLGGITRGVVVESITEVVEKYKQMHVHHAHVRFHEHKEKLRGTPLIQCQIRLRTSEGQIAGSGEGYGAEQSFRVALDKLERNVLEEKSIKADEEYRGQLLRKLDEL